MSAPVLSLTGTNEDGPTVEDAVRVLMPALRSAAWADRWAHGSPALQALQFLNDRISPEDNIDYLTDDAAEEKMLNSPVPMGAYVTPHAQTTEIWERHHRMAREEIAQWVREHSTVIA